MDTGCTDSWGAALGVPRSGELGTESLVLIRFAGRSIDWSDRAGAGLSASPPLPSDKEEGSARLRGSKVRNSGVELESLTLRWTGDWGTG